MATSSVIVSNDQSNTTALVGRDAILKLLDSRFKTNQSYTQLGQYKMVVVNPLITLEATDDAILEEYGKFGYKDISLDSITPTLQPHVFDVATRAYLLMRRKFQDQAIVLRGSSGSGKSTTRHHIIRELVYLSTRSGKHKKKSRQVMGVNSIFESFGTNRSDSSNTSSCYSQFQTLEFNHKGRLVGCKMSIFLFDKSRISNNNDSQFNIFYQLLEGTTSDEKEALHINNAGFRYLRQETSRDKKQDMIGFNAMKEAMKICGFKTKTVAQICQLLAAILHLGNIEFTDTESSFKRGGSYSSLSKGTSGGSSESCSVKEIHTLSLVAAALGISISKLEMALTHKVKLIGDEFCTAFLNQHTASEQRDSLAHTLYSALILWLTNVLNQKLQNENTDAINSISILDTVGFKLTQSVASFHNLCENYITEQINRYCFDRTVDPESVGNSDFVCDGVWPYRDPHKPTASLSLHLYHGTSNNEFGLIPLINKESKRFQTHAIDATDNNLLNILFQNKQASQTNEYSAFLLPSSPTHSFAIRHYDVLDIDYSVDGFLESNLDFISPEFIHMFQQNCTNDFVSNLFEMDSFAGWVTETHPRDKNIVIRAQLPAWSGMNFERPSYLQNKKYQRDKDSGSKSHLWTVFDQVTQGIDQLKQKLDATNMFEIFHLIPNNKHMPGFFDTSFVEQQMSILKVVTHANFMDLSHGATFQDFIIRYEFILKKYIAIDEALVSVESQNSRIDEARQAYIIEWAHLMSIGENDIRIGKAKVWLSFGLWKILEAQLRSMEKEMSQLEKQARLASLKDVSLEKEADVDEEKIAISDRWYNGSNQFHYEYRSDMTLDDDTTETETNYDSFANEWGDGEYRLGPNMDMSKMMKDYHTEPKEQIEEVSISSTRRWWTRFVYFSTWWIPSFTIKYIGKMTRSDVQMAWREKVTLCILIFLFSGFILFFIVGLGQLICPGTQDLYSANDVSVHQSISDYWVSVRGKVYDVTQFVATDHGTAIYTASKSSLLPLAGQDLSHTFPPPLTIACSGLVTDPSISITPNESVVLGPFVHLSGPQQPIRSMEKLRDSYWLNKYFGPTMNVYKKGDLVISKQQIKDDYTNWGRLIASIDNRVYDLTDYMETARKYPTDIAGVPNYHYLDSSVETMFTKFGGKDMTEEWKKYSMSMDEQKRSQNKACLDNVFYIGRVDYRDSIRCTLINYVLLSFAIIMSIVIVVKFLAALQFGAKPTPEDHDKFVICQVPCYTEDEESLRKTIDSITVMDYDDKHKLLFLIADGMIIGSGNDKPTPQILLEILGHDKADNPEALKFKSIGEGSKQLNYGKVYSGIYQYEGHVVPYIVVAKVGKSSERTKPGNRGKRDSQIICMNFLSKVHFDTAMSPLELEIFYHMKYIIGIEPKCYEYILMVDSDTEVYSDSLNRLISCMLHDSKVIGLCGETELGNEDRSWATMIQVYEYYISHHLVKAFESLFGSVTCLPGCFCLYRIRTAMKSQPLIIAPSIIQAYSDNQVDTLHKKNLLHLGEDRYLTTLMMKNFPQYKMMFTPYAKCKTIAPDQWRVLLSQRRRWINSTIHNLLELILLQQLCGFCCFSMRFVVLMDLIGTITLPSTVIYLVYLMYEIISGSGPVPVIALGMLGCAYGLQSLIFILKRQWQHIGWMIIYILAIPIFSFFLPLYAFWHFDDFSWGNTRVVVGDKTKQIIVADDETFDERMIPLIKWSDYEQDMLEASTLASEIMGKSYSCQSGSFSSRKCHKHRGYCSGSLSSYPSTKTKLSHASSNNSRKLQPFISDFIDSGSSSQLTIDLGSVYKSKSFMSSERSFKTSNLPDNSDLEIEIINILHSSDLMALTKKQVRDQLSFVFGVDLSIKKGFINTTIDRLLEQDEA